MGTRIPVVVAGVTWYASGAAAAWPAIAAGTTVTGKAGVNTQFAGAGNDTMIGGGGSSDNIFYVDANDTVISPNSDETDTEISYWGSLALAPHVADGTLEGPGTLTGNAENNILTAASGYANTIVAGTGNDLMIGAATGNDRFVVAQGNGATIDVIQNFVPGSDVLELDSAPEFAGATLATIKAAMTQSGANVILTLSATQTVVFTNITVASFKASNFSVPLDTTNLKLTFSDAFTTISASASGMGTTWQYMSGDVVAGVENFLPTDTGVHSPFSDANGVLDITASPVSTASGLSYTSGGLTTAQSFAQTYGIFEINAELPAGAGMSPAFWLLPQNGAPGVELDAVEQLGSDPNTIYGTVHASSTASTTDAVQTPVNTSTSFNTYAVDWEPATITFYFNGNAIASQPTPSDMNTPMYLLIDLAVGAAGSWAGAATGEAASMLVNWVQAYATANTIVGMDFNGWNASLSDGNGNYTITGNGYDGTIQLGNGNDTITLTAPAGIYGASANSITTGSGNQSIATNGSYNTIVTGAGTSVINAGVSGNSVTVGATASGTTVLSASGSGNSFTSTGAGNVTVTDAGGQSTVNLKAGNDTITLGGTYNTVTLGAGNSVVAGGAGNDTITTGAGNSTISVTGFNNVLDAGPGANSLAGGAGNDRFILNPAGSGVDTISNFTLTGHDILDFTQALSGLKVLTATAAQFNLFVTTQQVAAGTALSIDKTGHGGTGVEVALLAGVKTTGAALFANNSLELSGKTF